MTNTQFGQVMGVLCEIRDTLRRNEIACHASEGDERTVPASDADDKAARRLIESLEEQGFPARSTPDLPQTIRVSDVPAALRGKRRGRK